MGNTARAQALAAESQNELTADPEVSVLLARQAVQQRPIPQAVAALRQAMDASPVRVALPTESVGPCAPNAGPSVAYSPDGAPCGGGRLQQRRGRARRRVGARRLPTPRLRTGRGCRLRPHRPGAGGGHEHRCRPSRSVYRGRPVPTRGPCRAQRARPRRAQCARPPGLNAPGPPGVTAQSLGAPNALAFNATGSQLAATTFLGTTVWDMATGKALFSLVEPASDHTLAFTPDGQSLVVGTQGPAEVVDVASGRIVKRLSPPGQTPTTNQVNPVALEGIVLVVGQNVSGPGDVSADIDLWDTKTWTMFDTLTAVTGTAVGRRLDEPRRAEGRSRELTTAPAACGRVLPDEELVPVAGQTADLNTISFSPSGTDVVTAANDGTARIYRADGPWRATLNAQLCGCGNEIGWQAHKVVALARSGNNIVLQAWSLPSGKALPHPPVLNTDQEDRGRYSVETARWRPPGANRRHNRRSRCRTPATRRAVFTLPATNVAGVSISQDDRLLLVIDADGHLHVTALATGRTVVGAGWSDSCNGSGNPPAVSSDDRLVAVYSFCGQVRVGRVANARPFESFNQHGQLSSVAFDPAGGRLALGSWDDVVTILNVGTDKPVSELVGHTRGVNGIVYSPQGQYIVTTSIDDTMRVWNSATGQLLQIDHDLSFPGAPSVSPDGAFVAETNNDNQVRVWAVCPECQDPTALLKASRSSVVSPLTPLERAEAASQAG